ncbi:signal peptide protein, YSIRK family [Bacteroidales bacterium KA00251]|nr:signal peptide protein, YSIRK family [Bacteroidales bacterium KA00251]
MEKQEREYIRSSQESLSHYGVPKDFFSSFNKELMQKIESLDEGRSARAKKVRFVPFYFAGAASIVAAVVLFFYIQPTSPHNTTSKSVAYGHTEKEEISTSRETSDWDLYMSASLSEQSEEDWLYMMSDEQ